MHNTQAQHSNMMPSSDGQQFPPKLAQFLCLAHSLEPPSVGDSALVPLLPLTSLTWGSQLVSCFMLLLSSPPLDGPYK